MALEPVKAVSVDLPQSEGPRAVQGLLGSDVLSRFGAVSIDYEREILWLGAGAR